MPSMACENGHVHVAQWLVDAGVDVDRPDTAGNTPLIWAAKSGRSEIVELLLDHKADAKARSKTGVTTLMEAATYGHQEVARRLIEAGADVAARDSTANDAHVAAYRGHVDTAGVLLAAGAKANEQTPKGYTALSMAAEKGHTELGPLLLANDADPLLHDARAARLDWAKKRACRHCRSAGNGSREEGKDGRVTTADRASRASGGIGPTLRRSGSAGCSPRSLTVTGNFASRRRLTPASTARSERAFAGRGNEERQPMQRIVIRQAANCGMGADTGATPRIESVSPNATR